jgi:hypothetical protein
MTDQTDQRPEGTGQLVDEQADQAQQRDQDLDQERVTDRNEEGVIDSRDTDVDTDDTIRDHDSTADAAVDRDTAEVDDRAVDVDDSIAADASDRVADTAAEADDRVADTTGERDELRPGEMMAEPVGALWNSRTANDLRIRWQELQLRFVDDPRGVVTEAQSLVGEAVQSLTDSLTDQQRELDGWASGGDGDTEQLRTALQRYRDFFDRMLGPT